MNKTIVNNKFIISKRKSLIKSYGKSIYTSSFLKRKINPSPKKVKLDIIREKNTKVEHIEPSKIFDNFVFLDNDIKDELYDLNDDLTSIITKLKYKLYSISHEYKNIINPTKYDIYYENIEYLKSLPICSIITIFDINYLKLAGDEDINFVNLNTGTMVHFSRLCPYSHRLKPEEIIENKKKEKLISRLVKSFYRRIKIYCIYFIE